jgi:HSP20 family protein
MLERWRPQRGLRVWDPFRELEEMERRVEDVFRRPLLPMTWRRLPVEMGWAPAIEMFEKEDRFVVKAELPGMKKEEIDISVVGDTLTIKGERKAETEVKEEDYYCCERSYGSFFRSIAIPSNVDADKIKATYDDGVLEVTLPKAVKGKPKKIAFSAKETSKVEKPKKKAKASK